MRRSTKLAVAAVALVLAFPLVGAQATGSLTVTLSPASVSAVPGGNATSEITITTNGSSPVLVHLARGTTTGGGNLSFTIDTPDITVTPTTPGKAHATVAANATGEWTVEVVATDRNSLTAAPGKAVLHVVIAEPPRDPIDPDAPHDEVAPSGNQTTPPPTNTTGNGTGSFEGNSTNESVEDNTTNANETQAANDTSQPPPSPDPEPEPSDAFFVHESELNVTVVQGGSAPFVVGIEDPMDVPTNVSLLLRLPLGWGGSLDAVALALPPHVRVNASGRITATRDAQPVDALLEVSGGTHRATVVLHLRAIPPAAPVREDAYEPIDAPVHGPIPTEPVASPARPGLTLRFDENDINASAGSTRLVTLYVTNTGAAPAKGRASLEMAPLTVDAVVVDFDLAPGEEAPLVFAIKVGRDIGMGSTFVGVGRTSLDEGAGVELRLRIDGNGAPMVSAAVVGNGVEPQVWVAIVAAGLGTGALGLVALARRWPGLGLFPLYARLAPRRALEHPRRASMVALLREEPGLSLAEVQRKLALSNGVARHHVALLEAAGVVRVVQDGPLRRLWPVESARVAPTPALRERALLTLRERGPMRAPELAHALGVSRQALHYHLKRLEQDGAILVRKDGVEIVVETAHA